MEIYNYHPITGEYLSADQADESPLEPGVYLIPAHACADAPPPAGPHEAAIRSNGAWSIVPDYRGTVHYLSDGSRHEIAELGVEPPPGALSDPPAPPWAKLQADRIDVFRTEAGQRISALFGGKTQFDLVYAEINANSRVNELNNKLAKGQALTVDEQAELDAIQLKWDRVKLIRAAENAASAEVLALPETATQTDLDAIQPNWPE